MCSSLLRPGLARAVTVEDSGTEIDAAERRIARNSGPSGVASGLSADPAAVGALRYDTGDRDQRAAVRDAFYNDDVARRRSRYSRPPSRTSSRRHTGRYSSVVGPGLPVSDTVAAFTLRCRHVVLTTPACAALDLAV